MILHHKKQKIKGSSFFIESNQILAPFHGKEDQCIKHGGIGAEEEHVDQAEAKPSQNTDSQKELAEIRLFQKESYGAKAVIRIRQKSDGACRTEHLNEGVVIKIRINVLEPFLVDKGVKA